VKGVENTSHLRRGRNRTLKAPTQGNVNVRLGWKVSLIRIQMIGGLQGFVECTTMSWRKSYKATFLRVDLMRRRRKTLSTWQRAWRGLGIFSPIWSKITNKMWQLSSKCTMCEKDGAMGKEVTWQSCNTWFWSWWSINTSNYTRCNSDETTLQDIFFAQPESIKLLKTFPTVLVMDSTYKTNNHRTSLFEIVGCTSTKMTYSVGFAFLHFEQ